MMEIKIIETGKTETLSIIDYNSGQDWVDDLIGNYDGIGLISNGQIQRDHPEENEYSATQETYDWWDTCIKGIEKKNKLIEKLEEEHGSDAVNDALQDVGSVDLEDQASATIQHLNEVFGDPEENDLT